MSTPTPDVPVELDVSDLLNAQANAAAAQIAQLIRRNAELEAANAALRRMLAATNGAAHPQAAGDG